DDHGHAPVPRVRLHRRSGEPRLRRRRAADRPGLVPPLCRPDRVRFGRPVRRLPRVRAGAPVVAPARPRRLGQRERRRADRRDGGGAIGRARQLPRRGTQVTDPRAAFLARAERGGMVPLVREVVLDADTPLAAFAKVARPPFAFLLESLVGGERWARYTFLGTEPREVWRYCGQQVDRWTPAAGWAPAGQTSDPVAHLADGMRALPSVALPGLPRFMGGAVGYLGYDVVRSIERLATGPADTLGVPDAVVMIADSLVILDNVFGRAIVVANVEVPPKASPA